MGRFTVLVIYRSPTNDGDLELFISDLERYCDSRVRDRTYWIVGDINCCILDSARSAAAERYLDVLYAAGSVICVDRPTRIPIRLRAEFRLTPVTEQQIEGLSCRNGWYYR
ncbi:hypothetical protein J6590_105196 [Homalodisca vitripennis]|nr:hypothetical protein J6590_105196 [Homalodisca vitripennis]